MDGKPIRTATLDRGIEQAIVALKKGAHLVKCGRRGKPKFCPFRLSADENILIWYSGKEERQLKLSLVTKIIPGQRTANFQRQPQPEKECQSFSLVYGNGERTLDLICKDKDQAESWFVGLTALVSRSHQARRLANLRSGSGVHSCSGSPAGHIRRKHNLGLLEDSIGNSQVRSLCGSPRSLAVRRFSDGLSCSSDNFYSSESRSLSDIQTMPDNIFPRSAKLEMDHSHEKTGDKLSLNSSFGSSSRGSPSMRKDDTLRDVLMWGEGIEGGILGGGLDKSTPCNTVLDALLPKFLESTCMLDVQSIACGGKHTAVVTRQGEVFCWGEEKSGRLGHKVNMDVSCPKVVEALSDVHVESIACGEYQTCALTVCGELYMWGESGQSVSPLDDGKNKSWWLPRRVLGPLEGICISTVACGEWHTAVVSSAGQLFTYGDGTFGVLGHGNLQSSLQPKEVESLKGLRVKSVACGPWHTAAIVEILVHHFKGNIPGGKLFTWGDSDKGRLGHADKERKLLPTCVAALVDHDFVQVSCGRMLTVALTATGMVCTFGSAVHGQLGNPQAQDKSITFVEGQLKGEFVKDISSGSYHVAVLTLKGNVYTWGMGANGQLGLGDVDNRNCPALVEALRDRQVCSIASGSSFTAAICLHKSISSSDQSVCSGCKMPFGFTRKKHNCYNCGLVFCHACSSKKALNASLAPNKSKQCRVCDPCFTHLSKHVDCNRQKLETPSPRPPLLMRKKLTDLKVDLENVTFPRPQLFSPRLSPHEDVRPLEGRMPSKQGGSCRSSYPVSPLLSLPTQWRQVPCPAIFNSYGRENSILAVPRQKEELLPALPVYIQQSPPRSRLATSAPGCKKDPTESDETLLEEVQRLRAEAKCLVKQCQIRSEKIQQYQQKVDETWSRAREEAAKCKAAKEVIKALTTRLNAMSEKFLSKREPRNTDFMGDKVDVHLPHITPVCAESLESDDMRSLFGSMHLSPDVRSLKERQNNELCGPPHQSTDTCPRGRDGYHGRAKSIDDSQSARTDARYSGSNGLKSEWVEQHESGVYITFMTLPCGQKALKRVRFSRKRFSEKEAERWWRENQQSVYEKYNIEGVVNSSTPR